jgi:hypothetical protein
MLAYDTIWIYKCQAHQLLGENNFDLITTGYGRYNKGSQQSLRV